MAPLLLSMVATITFSILFQIPRKAIVPVGLLGGVAWGVLTIATTHGMNTIAASFLASLAVSLLSEACARMLRMPVSIFSVPGIVILVPGITAYMAMKSFVTGQYIQGVVQVTQTALVAGGIASGLVIAGVLYRFGRRRRV